jgi:hypothetical protein
MRLKFWKKEKAWCPLFMGNGSRVICLGTPESRTPNFVHTHCKNRDNLCQKIITHGLPPDVQLRKGESYNEELLKESKEAST